MNSKNMHGNAATFKFLENTFDAYNTEAMRIGNQAHDRRKKAEYERRQQLRFYGKIAYMVLGTIGVLLWLSML